MISGDIISFCLRQTYIIKIFNVIFEGIIFDFTEKTTYIQGKKFTIRNIFFFKRVAMVQINSIFLKLARDSRGFNFTVIIIMF